MSTEPDSLRVVIVDDHEMVRQALASFLQDNHSIDVVGQASDASAALNIVDKTTPDLLVLDYSIPEGGAMRVIKELVARKHTTRILVLTVHDSSHYAVRILEAGAHGFMVKSSAIKELAAAIDVVRKGEVYVTPDLLGEVLAHMRQPKRQRVGLAALSDRELQVLCHLGEGMSLSEIAKELRVSTSAASTYRLRLLDKLNLKTTADAIRFALEQRIVT
jgi:DNA-binding NarL/FixJ family response regulator